VAAIAEATPQKRQTLLMSATASLEVHLLCRRFQTDKEKGDTEMGEKNNPIPFTRDIYLYSFAFSSTYEPYYRPNCR
jgi:superfamily II DNA/RNA helicase